MQCLWLENFGRRCAISSYVPGTSKKSTMHTPEEEGTVQTPAEGAVHTTAACDLGMLSVNVFFMQLVKDQVHNCLMYQTFNFKGNQSV